MAVDATFHFAWVDDTETTFVAGTHAREDESVFGFEVAQQEGEFATFNVRVIRPTSGLLNASRKQYAWLSVTHDGTTTALAFGRVVGFPSDLQKEIVTLEFIAQFPGWETTRETLFASLKTLPFWDPAFIAERDLTVPETALEGRRALYHYHRTTGAITLSDIIDGAATETVNDHFADTLQWAVVGTPARRVKVSATVDWEQRITGVTQRVNTKIKREFPGSMVNSFTGPALQQAWPKAGDSAGGDTGYVVTRSACTLISPTPDAMTEESSTFKTKVSDGEQALAKALFGSTQTSRDATIRRWWFKTVLDVQYDYRQSRSETITATIENDVQALAFDSDGGELRIDLQAENVVELGLMPRSYSSYFLTPRGKQSFGHLLARAQALLATSARAVEITFQRPFFDALSTSCANSITIEDDSLPGGTATGKIKSYRLAVDGETGETTAEITIAVSVGNGLTYSAAGVDGDYCLADYVGSGYQSEEGETYDSSIPTIIFESYSNQVPSDPAIISKVANADIVQSITVANGPAAQDALLIANQYPTRDDVPAVVDQNPTTINIQLRSLAPVDDLSHTITVAIAHPFAAPKGIDLAA